MGVELKFTFPSTRAANIARAIDISSFLGPTRDGLQKVILLAEGAARKAAKPHGEDTGETARAIQSSISPLGIPMYGKVFTKQIGASAIDKGRRPGAAMPPIQPIEDWARRHNIEIPAFVLARSIGRKGTKGLHFMKAAKEEAKRAMPYVRREIGYNVKRKILGKL